VQIYKPGWCRFTICTFKPGIFNPFNTDFLGQIIPHNCGIKNPSLKGADCKSAPAAAIEPLNNPTL